MSAAWNSIRFPASRPAVNSSRVTSPPPMATITSLLSTIATDVGERRFVVASSPPHVASPTTKTWSTQEENGTLFTFACEETMPAVVNPLRFARS
jgi:hypothetical protein